MNDDEIEVYDYDDEDRLDDLEALIAEEEWEWMNEY
jgi:hypothetical protein